MNKPATVASQHEALVFAMVTLSAADNRMTDPQLAKIGDIVRSLPIFADFDPEQLVPTAEACGAILQQEDGLEQILSIVAALPARLHETAYALAVEVAAAERPVAQEELRFLQMLRDRLELDRLAVAAIEHGAQVRYRS